MLNPVKLKKSPLFEITVELLLNEIQNNKASFFQKLLHFNEHFDKDYLDLVNKMGLIPLQKYYQLNEMNYADACLMGQIDQAIYLHFLYVNHKLLPSWFYKPTKNPYLTK